MNTSIMTGEGWEVSTESGQVHPLLYYLYYDAKIAPSTDGQGVMETTLKEEYQHATKLIGEFRAGDFPITIDGKPVRFNDLPASKKNNFTLEKLQHVAARYVDNVDAGDAHDTSRR